MLVDAAPSRRDDYSRLELARDMRHERIFCAYVGVMASSRLRQNPAMARLVDVVSALAAADPAATIYAVPPFAAGSDAAIFAAGDEALRPARFAYLLEVALARHVLEVWSNWRDGKQPAPGEAGNAVIYYAQRDAYEPAD